MFRAAAAGPYDEAVAKATDETLTSEDWGAIIDLCDRVGADGDGPKEVVQSVIKRLAHRNANVQLYTLELANALSQNCGKELHRELASRAFTEALLKVANDRTTHNQVKAKILERMKAWSDMFKDDADLGIMYDAYYRLKQNNPSLEPPSAPQKNRLTDVDRQKEEEELQMALKLSLQEEEKKKKRSAEPAAAAPAAAVASTSSSAPPDAAPAASQTGAPVSSGTTAATVSRVRALFDFVPSEPGELEFKKGDVIAVLESVYKDWWRGSLRGNTGIFPLNYVEKLTDPTPDELQREAQMEAEVFAEIKNVEKLLTLLSASNTAPREEDNDEIAKLYHQTTAIRPKLIRLIEKYSQKKDDFTQLNEKFIKARRDYEALLESSMAHPPQPGYHHYMPPAGYPPAGQYHPPQGPSPDQRYYTPGPGGPQGPSPGQGPPQDYHVSSPPPGSQRPNQTTPAPFYVAGSEIPANAPAPLNLPVRQSGGPSGPPGQEQGGGRPPAQPTPLNTSSPGPPPAQYAPYSQSSQRPTSTYGAQELATSVYDSPISANAQDINPAAPYSPDDPYNAPPSTAPGPLSQAPLPPPSQPQYQGYQPPSHDGPHSAPSGAPPPAPGAARPDSISPPPGGSYDARQGLPSQVASQQQYKPYVPPPEPSAPGPADYYRQGAVNSRPY
ncbi:hypothetical protein VUR80DRAFT_2835 [Thermomyces stellatus]